MKYTNEELCRQHRKNRPNYLQVGPFMPRTYFKTEVGPAGPYKRTVEHVILDVRDARVVAVLPSDTDVDIYQVVKAMNAGWHIAQGKKHEVYTELMWVPYRRALMGMGEQKPEYH